MRLEGPGRPHARERPAIEVGRRGDGDRLARRQRDQRLTFEEGRELFELLAADATSSPGAGCLAFIFAQAASGSPPFMRPASDRKASCVSCSSRVAIASSQSTGIVIPSSSRSFCSNLSRPSLKEARAFGAISVSRYCTYGADGLRRLGLGVGEIAEQMKVVDAGERAGQVFVDELQRPAHRLDADLDVDAGRVFDVVARSLDETRGLAQLRQHAARAFRRRRVREQRLRRETRREEIGIELRVAFPRAHGLELEHPALEMRGQHPVLEPLDAGQRFEIDLVQTPQVSRQGVRLAFDPIPADVLEEVVVRVHAIQRRVRGMGLVQVTEKIVDEMRKGLGSNHRFGAWVRALPDELGAPTQIRQWYN